MDLDAKDGLYDTVNDIEKLAEQYVNTNYPEYVNPKEKAAAIEDVCWGYNKAKEMLYTEISDEEILNAAKESRLEDLITSIGSFELGARWYREQLKQRK
jgi:hypothetical protein